MKSKNIVTIILLFSVSCFGQKKEMSKESLVIDSTLKIILNNVDRIPIINFEYYKSKSPHILFYILLNDSYPISQLIENSQAQKDSLFYLQEINQKYKFELSDEQEANRNVSYKQLTNEKYFLKKAKENESLITIYQPTTYNGNYYVRTFIKTREQQYSSIVIFKFDNDLRLCGFSQTAGVN